MTIAAWLTGPLYGINLVLAVCAISSLIPYLHCSLSRALILCTILISMTCFAHAALLFVTIIELVSDPVHLAKIFLPIIVAISVIYVVNMVFSQALIVWRVYAMSRHCRLLTALFLSSMVVSVVLNILVVQKVKHMDWGSFFDASTNEPASLTHWFISAWSISLAIQGAGSAIIVWKTWSVPVEVRDSGCFELSRTISTVFFIMVDSGCLLVVVEFISLIWVITVLNASGMVFLVILGQLSALVPLTIILREVAKARRDIKKSMVNATSAFVVNGLPGSEAQHARTSLSILSSDATPRGTMVVIRRSEHKHSDMVEEESVSDHLSTGSV